MQDVIDPNNGKLDDNHKIESILEASLSKQSESLHFKFLGESLPGL